VVAYLPDAGDVISINFDPQAGHEQAGRRPALVLSPRGYNKKSSLAVVVPITNQVKGYPFEVPMAPKNSVTGAVLADQLKSVDWNARHAKFIEKAPTVLSKVQGVLKALLGLQ